MSTVKKVFRLLAGFVLWTAIFALLILYFGILTVSIFGIFISGSISDWNVLPFAFAGLFIAFVYIRLSFDIFEIKNVFLRFGARVVYVSALILPLFLLWTNVSPAPNAGEFEQAVENRTFSLDYWQAREASIEAADTLIFWNSGEGLTQKEESEYVLGYLNSARLELQLSRRELSRGLSEEEQEILYALRENIAQHEFQARKILAGQIEDVLRDEGIINPWDKTGIFFPPVNFRVTKPPKVLIVAHRDKLEEKRRVFLDPDLSLEQVETIERQVEEMGYSALVTGLGGVGTYPSIVIASSPERTIEVIVHEWIHNYVTFTPLGMTGKTTKQRILEETTASIIDKEITNKLWERFYAPYIEKEQPQGKSSAPAPAPDERINFGEAMRDIRLHVEELLAEGRVEEAEAYMAQKRDWLESEGHYVRKLNQAYLTFRGFYATGAFKDANDGLGAKIIRLRELSPSLKVFLETITEITSVEELEEQLKVFVSTYGKSAEGTKSTYS